MFFPGKSNLSFRRGLIYRHPGATDNLIELKVSNREEVENYYCSIDYHFYCLPVNMRFIILGCLLLAIQERKLII